MIDLEKRIESAMDMYCSKIDAMHVPPRDTDIDVVLSDCLREITGLKQKLEKLESGEFVLMPRKLSENMVLHAHKYHEGEPYLPYSLYESFVEAVEKDHG